MIEDSPHALFVQAFGIFACVMIVSWRSASESTRKSVRHPTRVPPRLLLPGPARSPGCSVSESDCRSLRNFREDRRDNKPLYLPDLSNPQTRPPIAYDRAPSPKPRRNAAGNVTREGGSDSVGVDRQSSW